MDEVLVNNLNSTVSKDDIVWFLWDLGDDSFFSKLNWRKYLIKWNHEAENNEYYMKLWFVEVYDMPVILDNFWILSHEPLYVNSNMPYANIFAHVHLDPKYNTVSEQSFCVSCDRIWFKPISFAEIKRRISEEKNIQK
jgi:calcineurin-like phosphoesterase family protein